MGKRETYCGDKLFWKAEGRSEKMMEGEKVKQQIMPQMNKKMG